MKHTMNELQAMRTLAQVVASGSFANAARAMAVVPAVVTRVVRDLENHLGARLITRTTRRLALTDVGQRYLERVRVILAAVDDAAALVRESQAAPSGPLRVRVPPGFAVRQLAPRLARFHAAHPHVTVELAADGPVESIDNDHDVTVIVRRPDLDGRFVARLLARSEMLLCATPAYLNRHGRPQSPEELAEHALLLPAQPRGLGLSWRGGESVQLTSQRGPLQLGNPDLQLAAALSNLGIAALPSFTVDAELADGRLERVLPEGRMHELSIWACVRTRQHLPASSRAFLDFLLAEFGGREHDPWLGAALPSLLRRQAA